MQFLSTSTTTKTYHRHDQHQHQNQQQPHHCHQQHQQSVKPNRASPQCLTFVHALGPLLLLLLLLEPVAAGSCREAQLCCSGRDSSCVVQKAPINAIIEDLSDKPCYCDHACLKLGDCCDDFKDHCGVLDCQVSDWGQWSECDKSCGTGMMSRARRVLQAAQNGGKHCPSLVQKRGCQGFRCHGHHDKKILREMALLLPAALSRNRHANDSSDIRRNLRIRYRDSYRHNREHEYCIEFEVIKASKACHKLPPYNQMLEGDRITVRCDLEALIQDSTNTNNNANINNVNKNDGNTPALAGKLKPTTTTAKAAAGNLNNNRKTEITNNSATSDDNDDDNDDNDDNDDDDEAAKNADDDDDPGQDEENMLDGSDDNYEFERATTTSTTTTTTTTTTTPAPTPAPALAAALSYHCRGEGLPGRTTRWSALAAPSCRGKWLRLTVGPPKKCTHSQFIFV